MTTASEGLRRRYFVVTACSSGDLEGGLDLRAANSSPSEKRPRRPRATMYWEAEARIALGRGRRAMTVLRDRRHGDRERLVRTD
jgi:hypothetical protein